MTENRIIFSTRRDPFLYHLTKKFRRDLLSAGDHTKANWKLHLKSIAWLLLFVFFYTQANRSTELSAIFFLLLALSSWFFLTLNVAHDCAHDAYFTSRKKNYILTTVLFGALGVNGYHWKQRHLRSHHPFPNVAHCDSDIDESCFLRFSPHNKGYWFHRYQHVYAVLLYSFAMVYSVWIQDLQHLRRRSLGNLRNLQTPRREIYIFFLFKCIHVFLWILLPSHSQDTSVINATTNYILVSMLFSFCFLPIALTHLNDESLHRKAEHDGSLEGSFAVHQICTSIDWLPKNPIATFFYGGLNSHAAHHLFPGVSHRHYHTITSLIETEGAKFSLHRKSFTLLEAIRSHFRYLKRIGNLP